MTAITALQSGINRDHVALWSFLTCHSHKALDLLCVHGASVDVPHTGNCLKKNAHQFRNEVSPASLSLIALCNPHPGRDGSLHDLKEGFRPLESYILTLLD